MSSDRLSIFKPDFASVKYNSGTNFNRARVEVIIVVTWLLTWLLSPLCQNSSNVQYPVTKVNAGTFPVIIQANGQIDIIVGRSMDYWSNGKSGGSVEHWRLKDKFYTLETCPFLLCCSPVVDCDQCSGRDRDVNVGPFFGHNHRGLLWPVRSHAGMNRFIYWLSKEGEIKAFKYPPPLW